jgi:hypothetical protein
MALWKAWVMNKLQTRDYKDVFRSKYKEAGEVFLIQANGRIRENVIRLDCFGSEIILGISQYDKKGCQSLDHIDFESI